MGFIILVVTRNPHPGEGGQPKVKAFGKFFFFFSGGRVD